MKKIYIIFIIFIITVSFQAKEHYIGTKLSLNFGGFILEVNPNHIQVLTGFSYSLFLKNNFSLQNNLSLGYERNINKIYTQNGIDFSYSFYPMFSLQKNKVGLGISTLGIKLMWCPYSYVIYQESWIKPRNEIDNNKDVFSFNDFYYWKTFSKDEYNSYLNIGFSQKISCDVFLGKDNDIIFSVFYCELDFLFTLLYRSKLVFGVYYTGNLPFFYYGVNIGSSISFKIKNNKGNK
ncbi:MAG: hypothetical protein A2Y34_05720 [Spirochaetes bacterium GWC1_27_15]|nr:MAG: hypothetical protein A2Z98_15735 [Spirochaetes bacterium GWB1_27_13]OHD26366.1 MAG: hypothetical protein A2Y34_05720 [Spirochaetes bacterium GWC1_27_15]